MCVAATDKGSYTIHGGHGTRTTLAWPGTTSVVSSAPRWGAGWGGIFFLSFLLFWLTLRGRRLEIFTLPGLAWMIPLVSMDIIENKGLKIVVADDPVFQYSGGEGDSMTPYDCLKNCMAQQLHQRYDKEMVFGITQGTICLCGYDYEKKKAAGCKEG